MNPEHGELFGMTVGLTPPGAVILRFKAVPVAHSNLPLGVPVYAITLCCSRDVLLHPSSTCNMGNKSIFSCELKSFTAVSSFHRYYG